MVTSEAAPWAVVRPAATRARVRSLEILRSGEFIRDQLAQPAVAGVVLPAVVPDQVQLEVAEAQGGYAMVARIRTTAERLRISLERVP